MALRASRAFDAQDTMQSSATPPSESDLVQFCARLLPEGPVYQRFANEARFGFTRILPSLSQLDGGKPEIMEVGAGSCILSAYLASNGYSVTAIEPLGPEFDFFTELQARVLEHCGRNNIPIRVV